MDEHPVLTAFLVMAAIGTAVTYALLFQIRSEVIESCERGNIIRAEVSERADPIRDALELLAVSREKRLLAEVSELLPIPPQGATEEEGRKLQQQATAEAAEFRDLATRIDTLAMVDCRDVVDKPWPFGGL